MKRFISFVFLSLALSGSGTIASAHDMFPPCWRGQSGTTFQEWGFLSSANPATPDVVTNPYGAPSASIAPGPFSDGWFATWPNSTNVGMWDLGTNGTMQMTIPNKPGASAASFKYIWVQVAQYIGGTFPNYSTVSIPGATYMSGQRQLVETVPPFGGIYVDQTIWRLAPNPASEVITITSPTNGAVIDQVVVDTICVDPAGTISPAGTPTIGTQNSCFSMVFGGGGSYTWDLANATSTAGTGWDLLNVTGTGTIDVQSGSGNPFTINVNSPAGGPANFDPSQNYNWTIATSGGGILNFASTKFAVNSSGFQGSLAGDSFAVKTANGGNDLVLYLLHPPIANNVTYTRSWGLSWKIKVSDLMTNAAPRDAGDTVSFVSVSGGSQGSVALIAGGTWVGYTPNQPDQNLPDSFTYTVKDNNNGLQSPGTVTLNVGAQQTSEAAEITVTGGQVTVVFQVVKTWHYDVERAQEATGPWSQLQANVTSDSGGRIVVNDTPPVGWSQAYYRLKWLGN